MEGNFPFCIFCGNDKPSDLGKGHVFPQVIGGKVCLTNCSSCNSTLGHQIEGDIKRTPFFAVAILKLGSQPPDKAFKNLKISDKASGIQMHFVKGLLEAKPKVNEDGSVVGNKPFVMKYLIEKTKKEYPNWAEELAKQLSNNEPVLNIAGDKFSAESLKGNRKIILEGLLFPYDLLAKIAFELMMGFGFPTYPDISEFYKSTFSIVKKNNRTNQIQISKSFYTRIQSYSNHVLDGKVDIEKLNFNRFHRVDFRIAEKSKVAYLKINFFEIASFTISICQLSDLSKVNTEHLGKRHIFPIDDFGILSQDLLKEHEKVRLKEDGIATGRFKEFLEFVKGNRN